MKDLTDAKITKEFKESLIKAEIIKILKKADKGLTLLEIRKSVDKASGKLLKELEKEGIIKKFNHYLHNSNKKYQHPETKKVDTIKGTLVHKYKLIQEDDQLVKFTGNEKVLSHDEAKKILNHKED